MFAGAPVNGKLISNAQCVQAVLPFMTSDLGFIYIDFGLASWEFAAG
jgi:hypothetical protein